MGSSCRMNVIRQNHRTPVILYAQRGSQRGSQRVIRGSVVELLERANAFERWRRVAQGQTHGFRVCGQAQTEHATPVVGDEGAQQAHAMALPARAAVTLD